MVNKVTRNWGRRFPNKARRERGVTLVETLVSLVLLMIVVVGVLPVFTMGFQMTEQQGDIATRTSEYAQDKMESLMALSFTDGGTNTTVYPPTTTGGTGLGGVMAVSSTVGSVAPAATVSGYVDYLDANGTLLTSSTGAFYQRQWSITTDSTGNLKTIQVSAKSLQVAGIKGLAPSSTLTCIKSSAL